MRFVVKAAGGNPTAVQLVGDDRRPREWYETQGQRLMAETSAWDPEQAGFLHLLGGLGYHFEMSGGEFCGNAARVAAMLTAQITGQSRFNFSMSGYDGVVSAHVQLFQNGLQADVTCTFPDLKPRVSSVRLHGGIDATLVDLGGIVHVVIEGPFPADYRERHRAITEELGLTRRPAVGVNWIVREDKRVMLHPVVWVRSVDTFYYETACGSGSIAAALATGCGEIIQPTGQPIMAAIGPEGVTLSSRMEVVHVEQ